MSERIVVVVPVRSLRHGKTRLSPVLGKEARRTLLRGIADRVVTAAVDSGLIETVLVVSPDAEALEWAGRFGPTVVAAPQPEQPARSQWGDRRRPGVGIDRGVSTLVSLFADLPLIDLTISAGLLAPDGTGRARRRSSWQGHERPPPAIGGTGTRVHVRVRRRQPGPAPRRGTPSWLERPLHDAPGIAFDLDTPDDWSDFM